jgi:hypothetical protein
MLTRQPVVVVSVVVDVVEAAVDRVARRYFRAPIPYALKLVAGRRRRPLRLSSILESKFQWRSCRIVKMP